MYSIISINIGPILAFGTRPQILPMGASAKQSRSRAKRSSGVEGALHRWWRAPGKAVEVEGALHRRWHASGVGSIEDLKRASGENLLSVERVTRPDIYIGARCTTHVH
jgi:hypothetical protein